MHKPFEKAECIPHCNWNLNTLSKDEFSRVSLLNAHNSIYKYDIISLCETSLSENEIVPENIIQGYHYHGCKHQAARKRVVSVFFTRIHYLLK